MIRLDWINSTYFAQMLIFLPGEKLRAALFWKVWLFENHKIINTKLLCVGLSYSRYQNNESVSEKWNYLKSYFTTPSPIVSSCNTDCLDFEIEAYLTVWFMIWDINQDFPNKSSAFKNHSVFTRNYYKIQMMANFLPCF